MARYLLDTNVLLRVLQPESEQHGEATSAIAGLLSREDELCITPQVVAEFWCAATRPVGATNGLGIEPSFLSTYVSGLLADFDMLEDDKSIFPSWLQLVSSHSVRGKKVHDARLVAVMQSHGVKNLLTFNVDDFDGFGEIQAVHPGSVG
jgi:predicted nucleic acid-binding protein